MAGAVLALLQTIAPVPSKNDVFHVHKLSSNDACYVGRDASGFAAILVRTSGPGRTVPLRLAGIEARFGVPCKVAETGGPERTETLTAILCLSREVGIEPYFAIASETLIGLLRPEPTVVEVADAVQRLVDLFQKLRRPATRSLVGLIGELILIECARDTPAAIAAWRSDADDRFDFVVGRLRVDAKASTDRRRAHSVSLEQADPPPGTFGLLASIWIEAAGGGRSLAEHVESIEGRLGGDHASILRLRTIIGDTLGDTLLPALDWRFDLALATSSLSFFDMRAIPAIRPPVTTGVSGVRFVSNLEGVPKIDVGALGLKLDDTEIRLMPAA